MKKMLLALSIYISSVSVADAQQAQAPQAHVVLITVDGFRPEFYKDAAWGMVHLRQAMAKGS